MRAAWRWVRRKLNRSEWVVRLLGLSRSAGTATSPGLVIVQVDGLSRRQLERAFERRRMPFLKKLITDQQHQLHTLHSGVPSTTAAFQGELFYGVHCAVPAYSYFHRTLAQRVHMVDAPAAEAVQSELAKQAPGLMEGGVSYCAFYDGGGEQHFCPKSLGLGPIVREMPLSVLGLIFLHGFALLRVGALLLMELWLALFDAVRGILSGHGLSSELTFIFHRVTLCVLLRELCVMRVKADVERGVPIVYVDFIGYDEQSHMRGPDSRFAHWTLKGIDDALKRVWNAARSSPARDYEVWIVSDHGQERTVPYREITGKWIEEGFAAVVSELGDRVRPEVRRGGDRNERAQWMGQNAFAKWVTARPEETPVGENATWTVVANGPVGHCYAPGLLAREGFEAIARGLVEKAQVPAAMLPDGPGGARVYTRRGAFRLPDQAAEIADDPEMAGVLAQDLICLMHQPNAGEIVILGHVKGEPLVSFALEHGGHGGIGPDEIRAFAVLPPDAPVQKHAGVMRAADLREGALRFLGRTKVEPVARPRARAGGLLRVMTYNVHSCVGTDDKLSPARIARVIARQDPDVVALQEVDVCRPRTGRVDQAREIARALEMDFHFHPSLELAEERYGNAILSRLPMRLVKAARLPGPAGHEPRGVLWVEVDVDGTKVQVISTHLGLSAGERYDQVAELLSDRFLGHPDCAGPVVVCGDFNLLPWTRTYRNLRGRLTDAQVGFARHRPVRSWPSMAPLARLDHVFLGGDLAVEDVEVPRTQLVRCSSDHLPVIVTVRVKKAA